MKNERTPEDKQNIKKQRIKMYFLEATKEIIIEEGVENVSVRKVADKAGYSYATIYNYFTDLNELLWDVKGLMINVLVDYMQRNIPEPTYDKDGLKRLFGIYLDFYFKNPNIFKFFYLNHLGVPDKETEEIGTHLDYKQMWKETFKAFVLEGKLMEKDIEILSKIFIYSIHGMLTLSFSNNWDLTKDDVHHDLGKIVDYLL